MYELNALVKIKLFWEFESDFEIKLLKSINISEVTSAEKKMKMVTILIKYKHIMSIDIVQYIAIIIF